VFVEKKMCGPVFEMLAVALFGILLSAVGSHAVRAQGTTIGKNFSLVLVGGGLEDDNEIIWNKIIELGGGKQKARFGVISAASENPCCDEDSSWVYYRDMLTQYGAAEVYYIPITIDTRGNNSNPKVIEQIKTLTGFFFGGGDQTRIIASFYNNEERIPSPALLAIRETLLATGGVVAGTSAGTDVQTINTMITGGDSYEALRDGSKTFWQNVELPNPSVLTAYGPGGIGLFPYGLLDTHFSNRGRHGRLVSLAMDTMSHPLSSVYAYGVDENTALVITGSWGNRKGTVIGERGVFIANLAKASLIGQGEENVSREYHDVIISRLSTGDVLSFSAGGSSASHSDDDSYGSVEIPSFKSSLAAREKDVPPASSQNIFGEYLFEFDTVLQSFITSTASSAVGFSKEQSPELMVEFQKVKSGELDEVGCSSQAYDGTDPSTGKYEWTYTCLKMKIVPMK
jgi:cyanophycinase